MPGYKNTKDSLKKDYPLLQKSELSLLGKVKKAIVNAATNIDSVAQRVDKASQAASDSVLGSVGTGLKTLGSTAWGGIRKFVAEGAPTVWENGRARRATEEETSLILGVETPFVGPPDARGLEELIASAFHRGQVSLEEVLNAGGEGVEQGSSGAFISSLEPVSRFAYGSPDHATVIWNANSIKWSSTRILNEYFICPPLKASVEDEIAEELASAPESRKIASIPAWVGHEKKEVEQVRNDGLAVLIYPRKKTAGEWTISKPILVEGVVSISVRSSLFEAIRVMEITWPHSGKEPPNLNLYGNHIAVAVDGVAIFLGVLTSPKVRSNKGTTMTWAASSHSYPFLKTHMNPQVAQTEWSQLAPLDIITEISDAMNIPLELTGGAVKKLEMPVQDAEGLRLRSKDDLTTSPVAFMQKLLDEQGLYLTTGELGHLWITDFKFNRPRDNISMFFIEGATETQGDISGLFSLEVTYNYGELARTYTVLGDRRKIDDARAVVSREFPFPIFRTVERKYSSEPAKKVAWSEMSKSMAKAVNIDMTVPGWTNGGTGAPWRVGNLVAVRAPTFDIQENFDGAERSDPTYLAVSGVVFEASKDYARTKLSLHHLGVFDVEMFVQLPFLHPDGILDTPIPILKSEDVSDDSGIGKIVTPDGEVIDPDDYPAYLLGEGRGRVG